MLLWNCGIVDFLSQDPMKLWILVLLVADVDLVDESPETWNDPEDYQWQNGKKVSVITKVKEKAKKWRQNLSKKKFGYDGYSTPSWGVALEDYEVEEEPENFGFHAYDSQHVTKISKDGTRQHQRLEPYITDKRLPSSNGQNQSYGQVRQKLPTMKMNRTGPVLGKSHSNHLTGNPPLSSINENPRALSLGSHSRESNPSPSKFTLDTLIVQRNSDKQKEKLPCPEMTAKVVPSETNIIKEKEEQSSNQEGTTQVLTDGSTASQEKKALVHSSAEKADEEGEEPHSPMTTATEDSETFYATEEPEESEELSPNTKKTISEAVSEKLAPAYSTVSEATYKITSKLQGLSMTSPQGTGEERKWDKGVSVKEYFKNKLEPGEDERALSQVISEVISPRRSPTEKSVVEKVKAAVSMLLQTEEPSSYPSRKRSSSQIPISTNAYEVEEENEGRILQAN